MYQPRPFYFGSDALPIDVVIIHVYPFSNGFLHIFLDTLGSIRFGLMKEGTKGNSHVYVLCTVFCFQHNYTSMCCVQSLLPA